MLSEKKKELLREFVEYRCENCKKHEKECGKLLIHRINRGYLKGEYVLRNILVICSACHKEIHYGEF